MRELERLVLLIEKRAKKSLLHVIDFSQDSLEGRLYHLVKEKKVKDDATAVIALYGNAREAKGYKMLKSRLKKRLYAAVDSIILDDTTLKPYVHEEQQCLVLLNRAFTLYQLGEDALALKSLSQVETVATELKLAPILLRCLELKYVILYAKEDYASFKNCEKELLHHQKIKNLETEALIIHRNARLGIKQAVAGRNNHLQQLPTAIMELELKWEETKSPLIFEFLQTLKIQFYELVGDFDLIISSIDNATKLTSEGVIPEKRIDLRFNKFIKLYALLQLRKYDEGIAYARTLEKTFLYGSLNWASYMENYFLLALQKKDFDLSVNLLEQLAASGVATLLADASKERWALYIAYFNLMAGEDVCHKLVLGDEVTGFFKLSVKDKEGFNVAIIILEIFDILQQNELEDTSLLNDRVRKYITKHLTKKEAERARLFLKLMLLLFRENLDVAACKAKGRYLLQKLKNTPVPGNAFAEVEIVPYEQLWEQALAILAKKERKALCK